MVRLEGIVVGELAIVLAAWQRGSEFYRMLSLPPLLLLSGQVTAADKSVFTAALIICISLDFL